jgi:hypothetical protein
MRWFRCSTMSNAWVRSSAANLAPASRAKGISPLPSEAFKGPRRRFFVASWKGSGRCESPNTFQTIAHHSPRTEQFGNFRQGKVLGQPKERGGAETEIKAGLWQCGFFKGCNQDCDCLVWNGRPKEGCEAIIGLYGNQWVRTQLK